MKNIFRQILAFGCAVYFLAAGLGFNVVRYCCDSCASAGIEAVASRSCEEIHHEQEHDGGSCCSHASPHHHSESEDIACSDTAHQTDGCHLWHMKTDVPVAGNAAEFNHHDFGKDIELPYAVLCILFENKFPAENTAFLPPDNIPLFSGRDILARHAVLLI